MHTTYTIEISLTLHDENTDVDSIIEQIADIDGVDVIATTGKILVETVDI